jgi:HSP20 family protein
MLARKETLPTRGYRDPFSLLRNMAAEFDRSWDESAWPALRVPFFRAPHINTNVWLPHIDVFEKDNRLVTKIDLPGLTKEHVKVEVLDGYLTISGERRNETEEKKENVYRCEREYGTFERTVPLPEGVKPEDVKATFTDGVLEVSVPLPMKVEPKAFKVEVKEEPKAKQIVNLES